MHDCSRREGEQNGRAEKQSHLMHLNGLIDVISRKSNKWSTEAKWITISGWAKHIHIFALLSMARRRRRRAMCDVRFFMGSHLKCLSDWIWIVLEKRTVALLRCWLARIKIDQHINRFESVTINKYFVCLPFSVRIHLALHFTYDIFGSFFRDSIITIFLCY